MKGQRSVHQIDHTIFNIVESGNIDSFYKEQNRILFTDLSHFSIVEIFYHPSLLWSVAFFLLYLSCFSWKHPWWKFIDPPISLHISLYTDCFVFMHSLNAFCIFRSQSCIKEIHYSHSFIGYFMQQIFWWIQFNLDLHRCETVNL